MEQGIHKSMLYKKLPFYAQSKGYQQHYAHENVTIENPPLAYVLLQGKVKRKYLSHDYLMQACARYNSWNMARKDDTVTLYIYEQYTTGELSTIIQIWHNDGSGVWSQSNVVFKNQKELLSYFEFDEQSLLILNTIKNEK